MGEATLFCCRLIKLHSPSVFFTEKQGLLKVTRRSLQHLALVNGTYSATSCFAHRLRPPVFRIRDVWIRIRIRIRGSVPLECGSGFCSSLEWLARCQQKTIVFVYLQGQKAIKKSQNCRNKSFFSSFFQGFSSFICLYVGGRIRIWNGF